MILWMCALAVEPVRLDAGPVADPPMEGFDALDLEGSADPRARWTTPPDRALPGAYPDPLAGDALVGGTLHLDLTPGVWRGWVMLGREPAALPDVTAPFGLRAGGREALRVTPPTAWDAWLTSPFGAVNPRPVFRRGEGAWERQIAPTHAWRPVEIDVGPGGVDVEAFGRPLQALVLDPGDAGDLAPIDAARRSFYQRYFAPPGDPGPPDDLPATVTLAGWEDPYGVVARRWSPELAQDERIGAVLWLPSGEPATARVDGLEGLTVELYEVSWLDAAQHAARPLRARPALLIPRRGPEVTLDGGQGLRTGLAIVLRGSLRVPPDAPAQGTSLSRPGLHPGQVTLTQGGRAWRVPIHAEVLPFGLPDPPVPSGFIWLLSPAAARFHPVDRALPVGAEPQYQLAADELRRMHDLGATAITIKGALELDRFRRGEPAAPLAAALLDTWTQGRGTTVQWADPKVIIRQGAFVRPEDDPLPDADAERLRDLLAIAARYRAIVPVWEEEGGWKNAHALALARALMPQLRALAPDVRWAANAGHPLDQAVAGLIDVVTLGNLPTLRREAAARVRAQGSTPWAYNLSPAETGPLAAWACGVEAFVQWHWSPSVVDPFNDAHAKPVWWYAARGPDGQVWHTALAERFADGITLTRWLATLEAQLRSRPDAEGQATLDAIRASLDGPLPNAAWEGEALAPASVAELRPLLVRTVRRLAER